jgi:hypothetical protein
LCYLRAPTPAISSDRRLAMIIRDRFYIDGEWLEPATDAVLEVISPASEQVVARVLAVAPADRAVAAARRLFDDGLWRWTGPALGLPDGVDLAL